MVVLAAVFSRCAHQGCFFGCCPCLLQAIAEVLAGPLMVLNIHGCDLCTDQGFALVVVHCANLRELDAAFLHLLSDAVRLNRQGHGMLLAANL